MRQTVGVPGSHTQQRHLRTPAFDPFRRVERSISSVRQQQRRDRTLAAVLQEPLQAVKIQSKRQQHPQALPFQQQDRPAAGRRQNFQGGSTPKIQRLPALSLDNRDMGVHQVLPELAGAVACVLFPSPQNTPEAKSFQEPRQGSDLLLCGRSNHHNIQLASPKGHPPAKRRGKVVRARTAVDQQVPAGWSLDEQRLAVPSAQHRQVQPPIRQAQNLLPDDKRRQRQSQNQSPPQARGMFH